WKPIAESIKKHSNEKELVVDLFLGSGVTCLESISLNRNFIGYDLNPMAIFISNNTSQNHFDENIFLEELNKIKSELELFFSKLYSSSENCGHCNKNLIINHLNIGPTYKGKEEGVFYCLDCGKKTKKRRSLTVKEKKDLKKQYPITKWIPSKTIPTKFYKDRFSYKGIKNVIDFYTNRNLYALSELLNVIKESDLKYRDLFLIAFSNTLLHASKLKSENVRPLSVNNYWVPDDYMEENVWLRFLERSKLVLESKRNLQKRFNEVKRVGDYKLMNMSSFKTKFRKGEVDYIITDPPYGDAIQYSELSLIWNSWFNRDFEIEEEVIINPVQNKGVVEYLSLLENSIREASRILKNKGKFTLCFHNKEFSIWEGILSLFKKYGFILDDIEIIETLGNSYNNNWSKFSPKSDIYLTFIKSKSNIKHYSKEISLVDLIKAELKKSKNISEIYDSLTSRLIWEIYYNNYKIDLSKLTIKKLNEIILDLKNGN
ncbi:MAG: DNA methyltransferase, partial [Candidatus Thorarchaeota archaeon]